MRAHDLADSQVGAQDFMERQGRDLEELMESVVFNASTTPTLIIDVVDENNEPRDLSAATRKRILVRRPNGSEFIKTLSFHTDGVDGKLRVTFAKTDLPNPDRQVDYLYQVDLAFGTWDGPLPWGKFTVQPNLSRTLS